MRLVLALAALVQLGECEDTFTYPTIRTNVAIHGEATQFSTFCDNRKLCANAFLAIDGNADMDYTKSKSCASCKSGSDQSWWKLDMKEEVPVHAVTITFRSDYWAGNIVLHKIYIGQSSNTATNNTMCKTLEGAAPNTVVTFNCKGVKGRYIFISSSSPAWLSFCEVQVSTAPLLENEMIVVYGEAMQSSTAGPDHNASKAIDGTNGTNFCSGMCSATSYEWEPWFCIALDRVYMVNAVRITNRDDAEGIRIFGAHIKVGESSNHSENAFCHLSNNSPFAPTQGSYDDSWNISDAPDIFVTPGQSVRFSCQSQLGRYVFIVIPGRMDSLSLCQVKLDVKAYNFKVKVVY